MDNIKTLCDVFFHSVENLPRPDLLLAKRGDSWRQWSSDEVKEAVAALSYGLMSLGVKPGDKVALISEDRPEWLIADYAILTAGAATVPPYATLNAQDTAYVVNDCDAEVAIVSNSEQAAKLLAQRGALKTLRDIIIMDVRRPRMTGYDACRAMKADVALKDIPIIFLSAKGQDSEIQTGLDAGAEEYLLKPFAPFQLAERVKVILAKYGK